MNAHRTPLLMGNWKLNHTRKSAEEFFDQLLRELKAPCGELAIAPVAPMLELVGRLVKNSPIELGAQNVYFMDHGAYTGEWSAEQLKELGVKLCIIGHSERRRLFCETDDDVARKACALQKSDIIPVCCVGESLSERESGQTWKVLKHQVGTIARAKELKASPLIFAYEPIWAIGTGKCATCEQIEEAHGFIRNEIATILGKDNAEAVRIIYGGSVTADNFKEIIALPNIDGALVGGASLQVQSFLSMVKEL
ncbi:MAG TPA: triose-phosphate isomerase [Myxococcota bacterium]|nr:triose-phosphate isomerase [Myxococcota bacterium]